MKIAQIKGRGLPIRGNDIDTDRILPAQYMKALTFAGVEKHLFENERFLFESEGRVHPTADPRFAGATILFVNKNFGCGSSREHAPSLSSGTAFGPLSGNHSGRSSQGTVLPSG